MLISTPDGYLFLFLVGGDLCFSWVVSVPLVGGGLCSRCMVVSVPGRVVVPALDGSQSLPLLGGSLCSRCVGVSVPGRAVVSAPCGCRSLLQMCSLPEYLGVVRGVCSLPSY